MTGGETQRATRAVIARYIYCPIGLEQTAQIAAYTVFVTAPDHFGHVSLGLRCEAVVLKYPREDHRADLQKITFRHSHRADAILTAAVRPARDHGIDKGDNLVRVSAILAPELDDCRLLAAVGEVSVASEKTDYQTQLLVSHAAELTLTRLHQELVAHAQILQLDLAACGVEVVPLGRLDFVASPSCDAINVCRRRGHEHGDSRTYRGTHVLAKSPLVDRRLNIDARIVQLTHPNQPVAGMQARICRYARVGGADVLAPPVVVHLIDAVDEDESGFREVVGGRHDHVPQAPGRHGLVDLAGHEPFLVHHIALVHGPLAPDEAVRILKIRAFRLVFLPADGEGQLPVTLLAHGTHELIGDQQRQVELAQTPVLSLGTHELQDVRMSHIERAHL